MANRLPAILLLVACGTWFGACSGGSAAEPEPIGSGPDASTDGPVTCDAMPSGMECTDACDGHLYWPSCVGGQWKCVGNTKKEDCPDAGCGDVPGTLQCADPCTGQTYPPTCEDGGWGCRHVVPDGGCSADGGDAGGTFECGPFACVVGVEYCHQPAIPGNCPPPDSGICPVGCPGCPAADPKCDGIPSECANAKTCKCLLESVCGSIGAGICQPTQGGLTLGCGGI